MAKQRPQNGVGRVAQPNGETRKTLATTVTHAAPVERLPAPRVAKSAQPVATSTALERSPPAISIRASEPETTPGVRTADVQPFQKIGAPYQVNGTWYIPAHEPNYDEVGVASWYGQDFHGKATANGETFDMNVVTAAHPTLPIPSLVEVTNLSNGRSMVVRVNDRGPFVSNRLIDLSARGAELLGYRDQGSTQVRVRYIGPADPDPLVTADTLSAPSQETKWAGNVVSPPKSPPVSPSLGVTVARVVEQRQGRASNRGNPSTNSARSGLYVQAGAFTRESNAERTLRQLHDFGTAQIVESETPAGSTLYRVLVGPVKTQAEAQELADAISAMGLAGAHVMASLQ